MTHQSSSETVLPAVMTNYKQWSLPPKNREALAFSLTWAQQIEADCRVNRFLAIRRIDVQDELRRLADYHHVTATAMLDLVDLLEATSTALVDTVRALENAERDLREIRAEAETQVRG